MNLRQIILFEYYKDPAIANDDKVLTERVWISQGWNQSRSLYENLCTVSDQQSIKRERRRIHQEGLIVYSKTANEAREKEYVKNLDKYSTKQAIGWL